MVGSAVSSLPFYFLNLKMVNHNQPVYVKNCSSIFLGNQMKTMHNIRLVSRDILDYCQCKTSFIGYVLLKCGLTPSKLTRRVGSY